MLSFFNVYNRKPITEVDYRAFYDYLNLVSIDTPNSIAELFNVSEGCKPDVALIITYNGTKAKWNAIDKSTTHLYSNIYLYDYDVDDWRIYNIGGGTDAEYADYYYYITLNVHCSDGDIHYNDTMLCADWL